MRNSLNGYCLKYGLQDLLRQWHPTKNTPLTPEEVSYGSKESVWWKCEKGYVWKLMIYSRAGPKKSGCPVCAGRVKADRQ